MKKSLKQLACVAAMMIAPALTVVAQESSSRGVKVHGSVQSDILFPQDDAAIGAGNYDRRFLTNTYGDVSVNSKYIDAGLRVEFLKWPLPGFEPAFKGWGVPNIYIKGKWRGGEVTIGDFYEQFGSGFILRSYEERSLGVDNSLRGARVKIDAVKGLRLTALGAVQRCYWSWNTRSQVYGADAELSLHDYFKTLADHSTSWTFGASYVLKHEDDEDILVPGTDYRLNLPKYVNALDLRTRLSHRNLSFLVEWSWKRQDTSYDLALIQNSE
ncbi:MAG: hypothetical protein K2M05_08095, partial [Paramuribaculum sp.]|nr:hypothetical protein [Paramuribaculum sp.]